MPHLAIPHAQDCRPPGGSESVISAPPPLPNSYPAKNTSIRLGSLQVAHRELLDGRDHPAVLRCCSASDLAFPYLGEAMDDRSHLGAFGHPIAPDSFPATSNQRVPPFAPAATSTAPAGKGSEFVSNPEETAVLHPEGALWRYRP